MYRRSMEPREPQNCFGHCATKYTVKSGDTIYKIASNFNVNIRDLRRYNLHIRNFNHLTQGDILCIPNSKPYCSFLIPTDNAPLDSYVIVADSKGIYILANLPLIADLEGDFSVYHANAVSPFGHSFAELSCISNSPTIWSGEIHRAALTPLTRVYISAINKEKSRNSHNELILFDSI